MSLDLEITQMTCEHCGKEETECFNYTYNVSPMWYHIFPDDDRMVPIEGLTGQEANRKLKTALTWMDYYAAELSQMNPKNGWGDFKGLVRFIQRLSEASTKFPKGIWKACR